MPTLKQSFTDNLDLSGYEPATTKALPPIESSTSYGTANPFLRSPAPPIGIPSLDNLQQFNRNGQIPQFRVFLGKK